jgi:hypothetical protein
MIKVESDMLVLDSSFTKEDALAINQFVEIAKKQERDRMINLIERRICFDALADDDGRCEHHGGKCYDLRQLIKGEK